MASRFCKNQTNHSPVLWKNLDDIIIEIATESSKTENKTSNRWNVIASWDRLETLTLSMNKNAIIYSKSLNNQSQTDNKRHNTIEPEWSKIFIFIDFMIFVEYKKMKIKLWNVSSGIVAEKRWDTWEIFRCIKERKIELNLNWK